MTGIGNLRLISISVFADENFNLFEIWKGTKGG
jgi:hypothetical protein